MTSVDSCIISVDFTNGVDKSLMLVGKKKKGQAVEVINAFAGEEAQELWKKLTTPKEVVE